MSTDTGGPAPTSERGLLLLAAYILEVEKTGAIPEGRPERHWLLIGRMVEDVIRMGREQGLVR